MIEIKAKDIEALMQIFEDCRGHAKVLNSKYPEWDTEVDMYPEDLIVKMSIIKPCQNKQ